MSTARDMLDTMTDSALETALWVGLDFQGDPESDPIPMDENYSIEDVSDGARADIRERLLAFATVHRDDFLAYLAAGDDRAGYGYSRESLFAHDYVLTCNHHGAGFWDRGLGELGERLTAAAHADGDWDLYAGDDGRLHAN